MLVRADALFEGVLGVVLLLTAASGALDGSDFPWIGTAVLLIVGWLLLILCGVIWSGRIGLRELVLCNALSALAGFLWLLLAGGWSTPERCSSRSPLPSSQAWP